jgi:large subunit ribosomal protein L25
MSDTPMLIATSREKQGTTECRRLRRAGRTPGNVYGHQKAPVAISVPSDAIAALVHSGHRLVECEIDGTAETTMFRDVQWDAFAIEIQHFDLVRIDANERVELNVPIELRGTAPGVLAGGMLQQPLHELSISCLAAQIPDSIVVRINSLEIGQQITVGDLQLPPTVTCDLPPETTVAQVAEAVEMEDEAGELEAGPVEPEVIGQKKREEEED